MESWGRVDRASHPLSDYLVKVKFIVNFTIYSIFCSTPTFPHLVHSPSIIQANWKQIMWNDDIPSIHTATMSQMTVPKQPVPPEIKEWKKTNPLVYRG